MPPPIGPMRVESINYFQPIGPGRPGIVIAVGILSIVIGCASVLGSVVGVLFSFTLLNMPVVVPATAPTAGPSAATVAAVGSLNPQERAIVIAAFEKSVTLTPPRRTMLDSLLAQAGSDMFPFAGQNLTEERVAANVSASGQMQNSGNMPGNDYWVVANGRIEVGDYQAVFTSTDGRQSAYVTGTPGRSNSSFTMVRANGSVVTSSRGVTYTTAHAAGGSFLFEGALEGFNLLLAVFLVISGIMVLCNSRQGRRLHLVYSWIKLLMVAGYLAAYWLIDNELKKNRSIGLASVASYSMMLFLLIIVPVILGCVYPIALLIVMRTKTVKRHYGWEV